MFRLTWEEIFSAAGGRAILLLVLSKVVDNGTKSNR